MMTPQAYEESLRELNLVVYVFGERIKERRRTSHYPSFDEDCG
jgi:hypothetical protein